MPMYMDVHAGLGDATAEDVAAAHARIPQAVNTLTNDGSFLLVADLDGLSLSTTHLLGNK